MNRDDYLTGRVTHQDYYGSISKAAGVTLSQSFIDECMAAGGVNKVPLKYWDALAYSGNANWPYAFKEHGDTPSLAGKVCTLKAYAKQRMGEQSCSQ